ncbi:hypothetical protein A2U01_0056767, partial [Trifolium medium]|nr:hypothetical protein [Trifolium medium]
PNQEGVPESVAVPDVTTTEGGHSDNIDISLDDKNHDGDDSHQKNVSESVAMKDARASDAQDVLKDTGGNMSGNTVENSQNDESIKTVIEEIEDDASSGKQTGNRDDAVDVDILSSEERNLEKTPEP